MRGLLHSKWGSVVVVGHVVILEAGHRHYLCHREFSFLSDVDVGVDGCGDRKLKDKELGLVEGLGSGEVGHIYWHTCKRALCHTHTHKHNNRECPLLSSEC